MRADSQRDDAVAIIGMSCRFAPDLDSPDRFWDALIDCRTAVREMPVERWRPYAKSSPQAAHLLRRTTLKGSFLDDIEGFDADFFGISRREAEYLDPQQRIPLELTWEALESAGVPPLSLRGSDTGVFIAANSNDYGRRLLEELPRIGAWAVNGTTNYGIANRISYFLDLRGPSLAVDTACAGSLTALHGAWQSVRSGEAPLAIAVGVNVMATPALNVALEIAGALAPDGRSKAFDVLADGYGRGEGAGVVVLKALSRARTDGDPVLAVIAASGMFQDGRTEGGMMAASREAQEHMLRSVYDRAGIDPSTVDYVEAHGTGTLVGDQAEAVAIARVFGADRARGGPCLVGSVKPNIGHVEAASGIAGVIKTVLALRHGLIPPSLHTELNPALGWEDAAVRLVAETTEWPVRDHLRRAAVSSYGVGGSIGHLVLEQAPPARSTAAVGSPSTRRWPGVFPVSGMSEQAVRALAGAIADWVEAHPEADMASIGHTLSLRRSHLSCRAAVVASDAAELVTRLRALADQRSAPGVVPPRAVLNSPELGAVWVFSGYGAQWAGMGRALLESEPVFAQTMDALGMVFAEELDWTPRQAIREADYEDMVRAQAMTFAMQVGLAEVWRHRGAQPAAVIGHSVGETAAAVVAGVLDLPEAARFVCRRARALRRVAGAGRMAMVGLPFQDTVARLADSARVVAAISASPRSTVVSGDGEAVKSLADRWRVEGLLVRDLHTDVAFHSHHMYEVTGEVAAAACELAPAPAEVTLYSTALDPRFDGARDSEYWVANIRQPVRFVEAIQAAIEDGHRAFLEISSHPLVAHSINETLDHLDIDDAHVAVTARRDVDELQTMSAGLAELHCAGTAVDWRRHHHHGRLLELPHQVWQHRPYWIFPTERDEVDNGGHDPSRHLLLGGASMVSGAVPQVVWQTELDPTCKPYPHEHQVLGVEIAPAAVLINTFAAAAAEPGDTTGLTDVVLRTPLAATPPRVVQVVRQGTSMRLASRIADDHAADEQSWITHCTGAINTRTRLPAGRIDHAALRDRCPTQRTWADIDAQFRQTGVGGYAFDWTLNELRHNDMEQLATITIVPPPARRADTWAPVIDAALTISAMLGTPTDADCLWMASGLDTVTFHGEPPARLIVHSRRSAASPVDTVDVLVGDDQSNIIAEATGLRFAPVLDQPGTVAAPRELVHEVVWQPLCLDEPAARPQSEHITVIGDGDLAENVAAAIRGEGVDCALLRSPTDLASVERGGDVLVAPGVARHGESADHAAQRCAWNLIHTAQQLVAARRPGSRLWCLTRDVRAAGAESSLAHAPLWGAGRIIAGEHPDMWGGVVDVDDSMFEDGARLVQLLRQAPAEDVISLRRDGVTCARLSRVNGAATGTPLECHPGGTYLITGGLGVLGLEVARWLVERGARRLVLVGRQGLPPRTRWAQVHDARRRAQIDAVVGLEALGATVRVLALDLTDPTAVGVAVDTGALELPAIRGVVHAAGVVHDDLVVNVDPESLRQVFGPKVTAAMSLHHHFPPGTLDFFVMFSSSGQLARTTGQTTYAAANSFLDALAAHRRAAGDAGTTSLGWTSWRGMGMARDNAGAMMEANARGLDDISSAEALRSWSFANRFDRAYYAVLRVLPVSPPTAATPMLRELTGVVAEDTDTDLWTDLPEQDLRDRVIEDVREQVGAELNLEPDEVDLKRPLVELGVDSVMTVALRIRLQRRYGVELPQNILWDKPTTDALARHLADQLRPPSPTAQDSTAQHDGEVVAAVSAGGHS